MGRRRTGAKWILAVNLVAVLAFALLHGIGPEWTEVKVLSNYVFLDREGVIDANALARLNPNYGFTNNPRFAVPHFIAGPALEGQSTYALYGLALALTNLALTINVLAGGRRADPVT
jgi:hypothetical protein